MRLGLTQETGNFYRVKTDVGNYKEKPKRTFEVQRINHLTPIAIPLQAYESVNTESP